jgi:hypothetical protein
LYYDPETGTQFTCFTGTKVQILTQKALLLGLFTKSLDRIQAYSTIFESVAKMKERFERDNKDIQ